MKETCNEGDHILSRSACKGKGQTNFLLYPSRNNNNWFLGCYCFLVGYKKADLRPHLKVCNSCCKGCLLQWALLGNINSPLLYKALLTDKSSWWRLQPCRKKWKTGLLTEKLFHNESSLAMITELLIFVFNFHQFFPRDLILVRTAPPRISLVSSLWLGCIHTIIGSETVFYQYWNVSPFNKCPGDVFAVTLG